MTEPSISKIIERLKRQPHDMGACCPCSHLDPKPFEECQCWIGKAVEFLEAATRTDNAPTDLYFLDPTRGPYRYDGSVASLERETLIARVEQLAEALRDYGRHRPSCGMNRRFDAAGDVVGFGETCDCGLFATLVGSLK